MIFEESGLLIAKWKDGHIIDEEDGRFNLYFKDGDGNLLKLSRIVMLKKMY